MSIKPLPPADFVPSIQGYSRQGAFRFWCQTVLPLVYDDSLSYYELLNKVVNYLNNLPIEVIEYVLKKTSRISNPNWKYAMTILDDYINKKINTLEKAKADDLNHKTKQSNNNDELEETLEEKNARKVKELEEAIKNDTW